MSDLRWTVDECPDSNGFATIRLGDGTSNGNTYANPIATIYDWDNAPTVSAAPTMLAALKAIGAPAEADMVTMSDTAIRGWAYAAANVARNALEEMEGQTNG